ncbi:SurA N-terminal domain-containing protein [Mangrovicella endophytica]|uniref:SurA N-terminal domain-containing protein n=1 Tax=Mangrovicella endophytica TaxID=2066697 RepID=UPI000C9E61DD|nr:SurA N-terminal domain-containing protein [Mangrovicella endophytica]
MMDRTAGPILALMLAVVALPTAATGPAQAASEVRVVVNKEPVTSYAIQQRAAFLKLRRTTGDIQAKATDELIDETLKKQEIRRRNINISDAMVDQAYGNFAKQNKLTEAQLGEVLSRAGFSTKSFKDYIRVQMGWGQAVQANMRREKKLSEQDVVQRMLAEGGNKPKTTEYTLQQVVFVIPAAKREALKSQRMKEANALRSRFRSCESTYDIAKGLRDVTVRELGRVTQPELPPRWKKDIEAGSAGRATPPQETERGVEFIGICDAKTVSDDVAAAMVFQEQDLEKLGKEEPDVALLKKLKDKAQITRK